MNREHEVAYLFYWLNIVYKLKGGICLFFVREIKYLYYYEKSKRNCSAGTCKCQVRDGKVTLDICLKKLPMHYPRDAKIYFTSGVKGKIIEQTCCLVQEKQEYRFVFPFPVEEIDKEKIYCYLQIASDKVICDEKTLFEYVTKTNISHSDSDVCAASGQSIVHIPDIHGEKEKYYVAEPKQLERFGAVFSQYAENSFLLHGFYNYRHIIVGPTPNYRVKGMRIGVPGNYYRRECVVAQMFGFVDFIPAKGEIKTGAFGYYYSPFFPLEDKMHHMDNG